MPAYTGEVIAIAARIEKEPFPPPGWDPGDVASPRAVDVKFLRWKLALQRDEAARKPIGQQELAVMLGKHMSTVARVEQSSEPVPKDFWLAVLQLYNEERARAAGLTGITEAIERMRRLPIVGHVNAGRPVVAQEHVEGHELVPADMVAGEGFVLRVYGDSMEPEIHAGDLVVIQVTLEPPVGVVVVITVDGETVLKRLRKYRGKLRLEAANPSYPPIALPAEGVTVHGYVVGLIRRFQ